MNPNDKDDAALSKTLKEWRVNALLPPGFQEAVWRRIDRAERDALIRSPALLFAWRTLVTWVGECMQRPAIASAYVAAVLAAGGLAGWMQGQETSEQIRLELSQRYVRQLDPYQPNSHFHAR